MNQFADTVGPVFIVSVFILGAFGFYHLGLIAVSKTLEVFVNHQRQAINNRIAADNGRLVTQNQNAMLMSREHLESGALYDHQFQVLLADIDSRRLPQPVPSSLHYAPHMIDKRPVAELPAPEEQPAANVPTQDIWQLWTAGALPDNGFLMGHNLLTGDPVLADWFQLYSALVGGMSGSGKSTLIRSVLIQSALQGGRFVVLDRHYGAGEESLGASLQPLRSLMLCDVAASENQMVDSLRWVLDIGRRRTSGQDSDKSPLVLVVDETTAMFQRSNVADDLGTVLAEIAQETRKVGVYALCIGQNFHSKIMPTTIRNSFASFISCRARADVARVMSGDGEFGRQAAALHTGQAVWLNANGDMTRIAVPNATQKHIELVARQCVPVVGTGQASGQASGATQGSNQGNTFDLAPMDARTSLVRQLFKAGAGRAEIVREVWQMPDAKFGDARFKKAASELDEIIRSLL